MSGPIELRQIAPLRGKRVVTSDGQTVGTIDAIHYDGLAKDPEWVEVKSGMLSVKYYLVPLDGAAIDHRRLLLPFTKKQISEEPRFETWKGLTTEVEEAMHRHFGTHAVQRYRVMQVLREGDWLPGGAA